MKIDEFEFRNKQGQEIEPTKNQLVIYIKSLHKEIKELKKALELAVKDKCKFENALLSTSLGIAGSKVAVPKKEQYYIEQAKEMLGIE